MLIYLRMIETAEDQSKFEYIYSEYRKLMFRVALKYLKCEQDAENAMHQAFVKIAENIKDVEPVSPKTRQYVVTIVENRAMDVLRMRSKHPILPLSETMSIPMEELDDEAFLSKCIKRLTDQQRQVNEHIDNEPIKNGIRISMADQTIDLSEDDGVDFITLVSVGNIVEYDILENQIAVFLEWGCNQWGHQFSMLLNYLAK